jgi:hypothetical protein
MAEWKKIITSGSLAELAQITASVGLQAASADINGGTLDNVIIGGGTAAAASVTSLDVANGNITNVGDIDADSISIADAGVGLNIDFGGDTTKNKISLTDNLADALNITEAGNSYIKFTTTNSSEQIVFGQNSTFNGTTIADLGTVTTADIDGGTIDGATIGGNSAAAGTFTAIVGTSLDLGDNDIANIGDIDADSISIADAASGLNIDFSGANTGTSKLTLKDNVADALNITEGSNSYIKFTTTNSSEKILVSKDTDFLGDVSGSATTTGSFGKLEVVELSVPDLQTLSSSIATRITNAEANDGDITNVIAGDGLKDGGDTGAVTLNIDVSDFAGDGLRDAGSENLAVDVSDFAGTGLEDDGSENLRLASQGTGIAGGGGSTLSVAAAQTSITSIIKSDFTKIGTATDQEYITFGTSNEVNTFVNNTERLSVTNTGVDVTGAFTVSADATINGGLTVNGTLTTISTANTEVKDQLLFLNSGSNSGDGGIVVQNGANNSGSAFVFDDSEERWGFATGSIAKSATAVAPSGYAVAAVTNDDVAEYRKNGNIRINGDGEIFIYVE